MHNNFQELDAINRYAVIINPLSSDYPNIETCQPLKGKGRINKKKNIKLSTFPFPTHVAGTDFENTGNLSSPTPENSKRCKCSIL